MSRLLPWVLGLWLGGLALAHGAVAVVDDSGRRVVLEQPARRIVTLSPHATELVYAAGAGDRLVAVASHSDWPPEATARATIGSFGGLDRERLLSLAPDLVIAWESGNRPGDLAWLQHMGIPVFRSEPRTLAAIADNLVAIGRLAGSEAAARKTAEGFRRNIERPCPAPLLPGFLQLSDATLLTVGHRHWLDEALALSGVRNVFADQDRAVFTATEEAVLQRAPALHLAMYPVTRPLAPRVIELPPAYWGRPTPRLLEGIERLCRALH